MKNLTIARAFAQPLSISKRVHKATYLIIALKRLLGQEDTKNLYKIHFRGRRLQNMRNYNKAIATSTAPFKHFQKRSFLWIFSNPLVSTILKISHRLKQWDINNIRWAQLEILRWDKPSALVKHIIHLYPKFKIKQLKISMIITAFKFQATQEWKWQLEHQTAFVNQFRPRACLTGHPWSRNDPPFLTIIWKNKLKIKKAT